MFEGLYIHVPFCVTKCIYCDFNSIDYKLRQVNAYLEALEVDLERIHPIAPRTIFVGGGTPTSLSVKQMERFRASLSRWVQMTHVEEFTVEANPGTVDLYKLQILREMGANRMSFGAQSFHPEILKFLGRIHDASQIEQSLHLARQAGFSNLSIDLIFGVPGQTLEGLQKDLTRALALETTHLSIYDLIYERGTKLNQLRYQHKVRPVPESLELEMFEQIWETLSCEGFQQYEISNYARSSRYQCQHNLIYWKMGTYQAVGPGAHGFDGIRRFSLVQNIQKYTEKLLQNDSPIVFTERLTLEQKVRECLMMGLRLTEGIAESDFFAYTGYDFSLLAEPLSFLIQQSWIVHQNQQILLTREGQKMADSVILYLVDHLLLPHSASV